jgi:Asp-tRNA(Asn)/Glu-tRNA(Gln) amidotransferase A subunit family amidase
LAARKRLLRSGMTTEPRTGGVHAGPFSGVSVAAVAGRLRDGSADPVELVEWALAAIREAQPAINAFVSMDSDGALRAATVARHELAGGVDRGPLHGVPVAIKDIVDTVGLATTMGSRHFVGNVPARDAEVVARLRAAGAVIVGKTTTHEFAFGPTGDRAANGPCANPRDPRRMAGGSSAGSAAAVAAGLVPLAVGTDTGGSVRIPAALCGVVGIRPSVGRVPLDGVFPLSWSLDTVGLLAGDAAGAAVGWEVLAGACTGSDGPSPQPSALRIGLPTGFDRLDPAVRVGLDDLVERLAGLGARMVPLALPDADELLELYRTVQSVEAVSIHHDRMTAAPELFDPEVLQRLRTAAEVPARDYARAIRRLGEVRAAAAHRLAGLDVVLLATVPVLAPPLGARDGDIGGGWTSPRDALLAHTVAWSVLGLPSMSVPIAGLGPGELPVGAQLVGQPGGDEELLAVARTFETVVGSSS